MLFSRAVIGLHHLVCRFIGGLLVFLITHTRAFTGNPLILND